MKNDSQKLADIIADAGGNIIGRTRLQKTAYLLEAAGVGEGFHFDYYYYGPYSEELAQAASTAQARKFIEEKIRETGWGGFYSEYSLANNYPSHESPSGMRPRLAKKAAQSDAILLELAATAVFFAKRRHPDPWGETQQRKPDKADHGRLEEAKKLYTELRKSSDNKLPAIS